MRRGGFFKRISIRESRGVLTLIILIVTLQGAIFLFTNKEKSDDYAPIDNSKMLSDSLLNLASGGVPTVKTAQLDSVKKAVESRVVELNGCDSTQLLKVPGIGPYYASAIIKLRDELGGLAHIEQLLEIRGIDSAKLKQLTPYIVANPLKIRKKSIAEATYNELSSNRKIGAYRARAIIKLKESLVGEELTLDKLLNYKVIGEELIKFLRFYYK